MKNLVLLLIALLLPIVILSQNIVFSEAVSMRVEKASLVQVAKINSRYYAAKTGYKYLVLEGELRSSVKKRMEVQLFKLLLKSNDSIYMALPDVSYVPFSDLDRVIRFKKKVGKSIYFEVPEHFTKGILAYNREKIGTITILENGIKAELIIDKID